LDIDDNKKSVNIDSPATTITTKIEKYNSTVQSTYTKKEFVHDFQKVKS
jgi:hypothetical protein